MDAGGEGSIVCASSRRRVFGRSAASIFGPRLNHGLRSGGVRLGRSIHAACRGRAGGRPPFGGTNVRRHGLDDILSPC